MKPRGKEAEKPTIIIRRSKKAGHAAHHGGAWKIAYADFVTAMMAFFLLMWLLGSSTRGDLQGIADYFQTPLKVALAGGSGSGDSSSVIQGGGTDLSRSIGQQRGTDTDGRRNLNLQAARAEVERQDIVRLRALQDRVKSQVEARAQLRQYRDQIKIDITSEGLRIQVVDERNRPMFDSGKTLLKDYTRDILRELALSLNDVESRISLAGHTDAAPYAAGERYYSNWELSADRANAARRELIAGGLDERKVLRVTGMSSSVLFDPQDKLNPINRRISIVVLSKNAEELLLKDGDARPVGARLQEALAPAAASPGAAAPAGVAPATASPVGVAPAANPAAPRQTTPAR